MDSNSRSNLYMQRPIIPSRQTTKPRKRDGSPLPIRKSNNVNNRTRNKKNLNSPENKSKSLIRKKASSKSRRKDDFFKESKHRGISPTLATSKNKIINNSYLLSYKQNDDRNKWIRDINHAIFNKASPNDLENFFFNGMTMKDAINNELSKALGKQFYYSIFCLPIFLFRSSACCSRILLKNTDSGQKGK